MVYVGPAPGTTIADAKRRLPIVQALLAAHDREPGLGETGVTIADWKVADLRYESHCLMLMLAPVHFRSGWAGRWHRLGCTLQREQNGVGAKCRQAKELVDLLYPMRSPVDPAAPLTLDLGPGRLVKKGIVLGQGTCGQPPRPAQLDPWPILTEKRG